MVAKLSNLESVKLLPRHRGRAYRGESQPFFYTSPEGGCWFAADFDIDQMAIEDLELNVGGTQIKGVWIAILLSFASTIGGGQDRLRIFSRLEALEGAATLAQLRLTVEGFA